MLIASTMLGLAAAAAGQVATSWTARQFHDPELSAPDEGAEAVVWRDEQEERTYVFVCGRLSLNETTTVIAVYKYEVVADQFDPGEPAAAAFYPDPQSEPSGVSRADGIAVDHENGKVYVIGRTPVANQGDDVVTLKLRCSDLTFDVSWASGSGQETGVRRYNGPGNLDDWATDVGVDADGMVYVLGTSAGDGTGLDLVTLKYEPDGTLSDTWADEGDGEGVRRWNNEAEDGQDRSCELAIAYLDIQTQSSQSGAPYVYVTGTSWNGSTGDDFVIVAYTDAGDPAWSNGGYRFYHGTGYFNDVATGLAKDVNGDGLSSILFVAGYSQEATPSLNLLSILLATPDTDYTVVAFDPVNGNAVWSAVGGDVGRHWNGPGGAWGQNDYCTDVAFSGVSWPSNWGALWLTGYARRGEHFDFATLQLSPGTGALRWEALNDFGQDLDDRAFSIAAVGTDAYVTGFGTADDQTLAKEVFTVKLATLHDPPCTGDPPCYDVVWSIGNHAEAPAPDDAGLCVVLDLTHSVGSPFVLVTGRLFDASTGADFGTVCLEQEP